MHGFFLLYAFLLFLVHFNVFFCADVDEQADEEEYEVRMRKQERKRDRCFFSPFFLIYILKLCIHSFVCLLSRILLLHFILYFFFFIVIEHENTMLCCTSRNCFCCCTLFRSFCFAQNPRSDLFLIAQLFLNAIMLFPREYFYIFLYIYIYLYECYNASPFEQFLGAETYMEHLYVCAKS